MSKNLFSLKNKVIILTGGLGFLGKVFAQSIAEQGATVCILDLAEKGRAENILDKAANNKKVRKLVHYFQTDITKKDQLVSIKDTIIEKFNQVDVLINNAAMDPKVTKTKKQTSQAFEDMPLETWNKELAVNLTGAMLCCQVFGKEMKKGTSVINVASIYGVVAPDQSIYPEGFIKPATYGVTKAGLIHLGKYLAAYWGRKQIRVNNVVFGGVENNNPDEFLKKYSAKTPLGRMAQPDDLVGSLIYLASDASKYTTGSTITVDGGWTVV